jgi:hypothetical protein
MDPSLPIVASNVETQPIFICGQKFGPGSIKELDLDVAFFVNVNLVFRSNGSSIWRCKCSGLQCGTLMNMAEHHYM